MSIFSCPHRLRSLLLQSLTLTGWVGISLMGATPGWANPVQGDRSTPLPSAEPLPTIAAGMPQAIQTLSSVMQWTSFPVAPAQMEIAQSRRDIVDTATAEGSFHTWLQLLDELGMTEDLRGFGRFTVFAPTDAAFAAIPSDIMAKLSDDRDLMSKVLAYHVISANTPILSDQISTPVSVRTLERSEVRISKRRGRLYVNSARVVDADIEASNGVIHAIDQVLIPDDIMSEIRR